MAAIQGFVAYSQYAANISKSAAILGSINSVLRAQWMAQQGTASVATLTPASTIGR